MPWAFQPVLATSLYHVPDEEVKIMGLLSSPEQDDM